MYIEKLKNITLENVLDMYPDFRMNMPVLINKNELDINIVFNTIQRDYSHLFSIILKEKFRDFPLKNSNYKENPYIYNECCYILDCYEWNIQQLREFLMEYCKLNNILQRTNLFVIYNFHKVDLNTQQLIGTLIEKQWQKARFWLVVSSVGKIIYKISSRVLIAQIRKPSKEQLKQFLLKTIERPTFEILIDKIVERSDDYGSALIYLDMLSIDPSILNRRPFVDELNELDRYILDKQFRDENYPKLREICYKLLEKMNLIDIIYLIICHFSKKPLEIRHLSKIIHKAAYLEHLDAIPNKQVWLLENWLLYCILVINDIKGDKPIEKSVSKPIESANYKNIFTGAPLVI